MLRLPVLLSFLFSLSAAFGASFPVPISGEVALANPRFALAAGPQSQPFVASNGDIALAVWTDERISTAVYATRIDASNRPLDPFGISIERQAVALGVTWNGSHFAVAIREGVSNRAALIFVSPEGSVVGRRALPFISNELAATTDAGPGVRLLFFDDQRRRVIVDGDGGVVASEVGLPAPPTGYAERSSLTGNRGDELIILRFMYSIADPMGTPRTVATRIDGDGNVLSSADTNLLLYSSSTYAVAGGDRGFLVIAADSSDQVLKIHRLDGNGVSTGSSETLQPEDHRAPWRLFGADVVRDEGSYLLMWHISLQNGHSYVYAANVPEEGVPSAPRRLHDWVGITFGVAATSAGGRDLGVVSVWRLGSTTASDVFSQSFTPSLEVSSPAGLSFTATVQHSLMTASGANGYLTAYVENHAEDVWRLFVRRVSPGGEPQDIEPIEVTRLDQYDEPSALASNGAVYLVVWQRSGAFVARRLSAAGEWIDAEPFTIGHGQWIAVASNGTDAVAVWANGRLTARRIALAGPPLSEPAVLLHEGEFSARPAIASNG